MDGRFATAFDLQIVMKLSHVFGHLLVSSLNTMVCGVDPATDTLKNACMIIVMVWSCILGCEAVASTQGLRGEGQHHHFFSSGNLLLLDNFDDRSPTLHSTFVACCCEPSLQPPKTHLFVEQYAHANNILISMANSS